MKLAPHWRMLIGLALGAGAGIAVNLIAPDSPAVDWVVTNLAEPTGRIFINLLMMLVAPLLFAALVIGIGEIDLAQLGRLGAKMFGYTVVVSAVAVGIGIGLVNLVRPGDGAEELVAQANAMGDKVKAVEGGQSAVDFIVGMVPDNVIGAAGNNARLLGFIVFSIAFGLALAFTRTPAAEKLREVIQGLYDVLMRLIEGILWFAPLGVAALLFAMTARLGLDILQQLGAYVAVVLAALALHMFGVYSLSVKFLGRMSPVFFFRGVKLAMVTAFSTASSNATLPTAIKVAEEELRLPRHVTRFVLTAGSAMNQNGTVRGGHGPVPRAAVRGRAQRRPAARGHAHLHPRRHRDRGSAGRIAAGHRDDHGPVRNSAPGAGSHPGRRPIPRHVPDFPQRGGGPGGGGLRRGGGADAAPCGPRVGFKPGARIRALMYGAPRPDSGIGRPL